MKASHVRPTTSAARRTIRQLTNDDDLDTFGQLTVASYRGLPGNPHEPDYELELRNVAQRVRLATVFGAFHDNRPVGCITFVSDATAPFAEDLEHGESSFRMLAVDTACRGQGVGEALVRRCLAAASSHGSTAVAIHSGTWMPAAHRLYRRLGFHRQPHCDITFGEPPHTLLAFRLDLSGPAKTPIEPIQQSDSGTTLKHPRTGRPQHQLP